MSPDDEERELLNIIAYLITGANILPHEPRIFGSMRLIEGARRIIEFMLRKGIAGSEILRIKDMIGNAVGLALTDEDEFIEAISAINRELGFYLRKKFPPLRKGEA
ncbi:MAG: hypothetical protein J7L55_06065 [Desulfurococcales archaeon]|nr:hypothetical protein [Desulfurococcales archaeon]